MKILTLLGLVLVTKAVESELKGADLSNHIHKLFEDAMTSLSSECKLELQLSKEAGDGSEQVSEACAAELKSVFDKIQFPEVDFDQPKPKQQQSSQQTASIETEESTKVVSIILSLLAILAVGLVYKAYSINQELNKNPVSKKKKLSKRKQLKNKMKEQKLNS